MPVTAVLNNCDIRDIDTVTKYPKASANNDVYVVRHESFFFHLSPESTQKSLVYESACVEVLCLSNQKVAPETIVCKSRVLQTTVQEKNDDFRQAGHT